VLALAEAVPSGIYSTNGIERYVRQVLSDPDRADDFRLLESELYLVATDLDTCERIIFGAEDWDDVPISSAVAASTALPMVYKPVDIKGRQFIDGGIRSTTNVDIAVEQGAKFIVVVTAGALRQRVRQAHPDAVRLARAPGQRHGLPQIGYQTFKLLAYQRLHEVARQWSKYPGWTSC
jgi:predicted acylesterase/phospholipase RssA